eukprot:COSAG06_NODE_10007_length_1770_cov_4.748654_1_plen_377_part_00
MTPATRRRLLGGDYTEDDVREILDSLSSVLKADQRKELEHAAHTHVLVLSQLFKQAEGMGLNFSVDTSELENQSLLSEMKQFEEDTNERKATEAKMSVSRGPTLATLSKAGDAAGHLDLVRKNNELEDEVRQWKQRLEAANSDLRVTQEELEMYKQMREPTRRTDDFLAPVGLDTHAMQEELQTTQATLEETENEMRKQREITQRAEEDLRRALDDTQRLRKDSEDDKGTIDQLKGKVSDMRRDTNKIKAEVFKEKKRAEQRNENLDKYIDEIATLTKRDKELQDEADKAALTMSQQLEAANSDLRVTQEELEMYKQMQGEKVDQSKQFQQLKKVGAPPTARERESGPTLSRGQSVAPTPSQLSVELFHAWVYACD